MGLEVRGDIRKMKKEKAKQNGSMKGCRKCVHPACWVLLLVEVLGMLCGEDDVVRRPKKKKGGADLAANIPCPWHVCEFSQGVEDVSFGVVCCVMSF